MKKAIAVAAIVGTIGAGVLVADASARGGRCRQRDENTRKICILTNRVESLEGQLASIRTVNAAQDQEISALWANVNDLRSDFSARANQTDAMLCDLAERVNQDEFNVYYTMLCE